MYFSIQNAANYGFHCLVSKYDSQLQNSIASKIKSFVISHYGVDYDVYISLVQDILWHIVLWIISTVFSYIDLHYLNL